MRSLIAALPLLALTACGGASGPESVGSNAPPAGGGGTGGGVAPTPSPSPTPTPGAGSGGGVTPTPSPSPTPTPSPAHFLEISAAKTFNAVTAMHSRSTDEATKGTLYQGNATTVRGTTSTINYDPRDAIFTINLTDSKAGVTTSARFQDPAHRRDIGNLLAYATVDYGVPALANFNYLQSLGGGDAGDVKDRITFFYQRPGSSTYYVSLAGYVRNNFTDPNTAGAATSTSTYGRGVMLFGDPTLPAQVPVSGTGTYTGGLLATMVANSNYFQWITGTSQITLDFSRATMSMLLTGTVNEAYTKGIQAGPNDLFIATGSTFRASGGGTIDMSRTGGFTGQFDSVSFTAGGTTNIVLDRVNPNNNIAGANSIDGTFYGPNAVNVGGNFRIVGGTPNQRVDILGAYTGAKQ